MVTTRQAIGPSLSPSGLVGTEPGCWTEGVMNRGRESRERDQARWAMRANQLPPSRGANGTALCDWRHHHHHLTDEPPVRKERMAPLAPGPVLTPVTGCCMRSPPQIEVPPTTPISVHQDLPSSHGTARHTSPESCRGLSHSPVDLGRSSPCPATELRDNLKLSITINVIIIIPSPLLIRRHAMIPTLGSVGWEGPCR